MIQDEIYSTHLDEAEYCVIDVETTGISTRLNGIIEIGLVKVANLQIKETFHSLINPGRLIPNYITSFTGISNEDVYDAPFFEDIADDVCNFISGNILTGHNLSFDKSFLRKELLFSGKEEIDNLNLCTLRVAKRLFPMLRSRSLQSLCIHFGLFNSNAHRALPDAEVTAKILIKMINEIKEKEQIKNVGDLINFQYSPLKDRSIIRIKKKLSEDIATLPDTPGVYYFLNSKNDIIYIGKAKSLRDRVRSYFSPTAPRKAKKIIKQASRLKIKITNSELTALLSEAESIKQINPRHNVQLKRYGDKYFLRITSRHDFPVIEICNYFDFDGNDYFGLFVSKKKAAKLFEMLNRTFALRECSDTEYSKGRACFLADIERCTAPCINKNKEIYYDEMNKVYEFLFGKNQFALNRLILKMKDYASREKFEKAAEVKLLIDMILSQTHKSSLLKEPVNSANVLFEINEGYVRDYILMRQGKIYIKKNPLNENDFFEQALEDYYNSTIDLKTIPEEEDLEKMKIILNWLIKNRNKIRTFYLTEFRSKEELYSQLTSYSSIPDQFESSFDIKDFVHESSK